MSQRASRRTRCIGVVSLLLGAPVCAELLQGYLDITGDLGGALFLVVFFAPMYGGAAVLIREVAVRTGRGWPGRLLLAAAFGVLMTTVIDSSTFTPAVPEIDYWDDIMSSTLIGGVSAYALTTWVLGHALMSVGAPLAVVEGLLPAGRDRPWLGRTGSWCWRFSALPWRSWCTSTLTRRRWRRPCWIGWSRWPLYWPWWGWRWDPWADHSSWSRDGPRVGRGPWSWPGSC